MKTRFALALLVALTAAAVSTGGAVAKPDFGVSGASLSAAPVAYWSNEARRCGCDRGRVPAVHADGGRSGRNVACGGDRDGGARHADRPAARARSQRGPAGDPRRRLRRVPRRDPR